MELFNKTNLKQFELINYIMNNLDDDHLSVKIVYVVRSDRFDVPYYVDTKILLSYCSDIHDKGIIHAMDVINHHRMFNLTESKYNEIKEELVNSYNKNKDYINDNVTIKIDKISSIKVEARTSEELQEIFDVYHSFFELIDSLA